jgi:deoxyribodipyrimidine photo-lyase
MKDMYDFFPATQHAALERLDDFVRKAGRHYAQQRNYDFGPGRHNNVSTLSPYVRLRMLDEVRITRAVLDEHTQQEANKFLTEVFWRTYWKGWMELRPSVWLSYQSDLNTLHDRLQNEDDLQQSWKSACDGRTGIAPFDAWVEELTETGYLHNHARMWFASIWIFTLRLPWQLGADFFLRHLLDGDAAVNTLSWRWVAGIQTPGKTYLATAENIAKFTDGRFPAVSGLSDIAVPADAMPNPAAGALPDVTFKPVKGRYGILLHSDDIELAQMTALAPEPVSIRYMDACADQSPWPLSEQVLQFRRNAAADVMGVPETASLTSADDIGDWAVSENLEQIVTPYAPAGPNQDVLSQYTALPGTAGLNIHRRPLDTYAWPLATKGFFPFRKHIPDLISRFVLK